MTVKVRNRLDECFIRDKMHLSCDTRGHVAHQLHRAASTIIWMVCVCQCLQHTCSGQTHNGKIIAGISNPPVICCCAVLPAFITPIRCYGGMCRPPIPSDLLHGHLPAQIPTPPLARLIHFFIKFNSSQEFVDPPHPIMKTCF